MSVTKLMFVTILAILNLDIVNPTFFIFVFSSYISEQAGLFLSNSWTGEINRFCSFAKPCSSHSKKPFACHKMHSTCPFRYNYLPQDPAKLFL